MAVELIADSAIPGEEPPIAVLETAINATVETINVVAPVAVAGLKGPGQFRIRIDHEVMLVESGQTTKAWKVKRAVEGPAATSHAANAQIFHPLTLGALLSLVWSLTQIPASIPRRTVKPLGAVSGTVTPNLAEAEAFTFTPAAGTSILKPINYPAGAGRLVVELEWFGTHVPTFPFITAWHFGGEPKWSEAGPNNAQVYTDDGVTFYGVGSEGLPANMVILAPGSDGQAIIASGGAWGAATIPPSGISEETALTLIAGHALTMDSPVHVTGSIAPTDSIALLHPGTPPTGAIADLNEYVLARATRRVRAFATPIATTQALKEEHRNKWLRVTKAGIVLTLETGGSSEDGEGVVIENASSGVIEVEGPINSTTVRKEPVQPGEIIWFWGKGTLNEWRTQSVYRPWSAIASAIAGAFVELNLAGKAKQAATGYAHGARVELNGTTTRLKGSLEVTGSSLKETNTFFTINPSGARPSVELLGVVIGRTTAGVAIPFNVGTNGSVKLPPGATDVVVGTVISFDNQTFTLS